MNFLKQENSPLKQATEKKFQKEGKENELKNQVLSKTTYLSLVEE